jgi:RNA polymerase sigma factor (sigma-70 family)
LRETRASYTNTSREHEPSQSVGVQSHSPSQDDAGVRVERLYEDYAGRVYRYCLNRLDSPEEAEDALQATYLNAWRSLSGGVEPLSARPWLFSIAANVCSTMLRKRLAQGTVELQSPETLDRIPTSAEPNDDLLGLSAALAQLPERQRHALLLRDWRGLSYDEIAVELNSSYQAVETLLFRARKSVAAGLLTPEPTGVPVRARALAPLPLLIPLKQGVSAVKSAFWGSIAPMKVSLGLALGAAAPLVAYGLLQQGGVVGHQSPAAKAAAPTVQLETPLTFTVPVPDGAEKVKLPVATTDKKLSQPPPSSPSQAHHAAGAADAVGAAGSSSGQAHGGGPDTAPPPDPATDPPPVEQDPPASQVTICHHTGSKKNPVVTITVGAAAVDVHLDHGDELGACAG